MLAQKEKIGVFCRRVGSAVLPERVFEKALEICTVTGNSFSSFITGQCTDALVLSTMCFIGMNIFRFPSAAVVSVIIGISALIPVIGPITGEAIGFLIIFMANPIKAVFFILFMVTLQAIDNNLIYPRIVGKSVGLPGLVVIIAVAVGGNIGGLLGVLLGVPAASAIYALTVTWLNKKERKKLPVIEDEQESETEN